MSSDPLAWSTPWLGLVLHTDTLFALAGVVVGMVALRVAARARRLDAPSYAELANVVLWAVVVARAWYVGEQWQFFLRYPLGIFNVADGGLAAPAGPSFLRCWCPPWRLCGHYTSPAAC